MVSNRKGYMAEYRRANAQYAERDRKLNSIRKRALQIVAQNHEDEYRATIVELCRQEGIEPPR